MTLERAAIDNVWRHWWAGIMAQTGGISLLPLAPLDPELFNGLSEPREPKPLSEPPPPAPLPLEEPPPEDEPELPPPINRAARRQRAHHERAAAKPRLETRGNGHARPHPTAQPEKRAKIEPQPRLDLPMAEWAEKLLGDGRIADITLTDILDAITDYFELFGKLRRVQPDVYSYFARLGTPVAARTHALFVRNIDEVDRIPNANQLPGLFGAFFSRTKAEYHEDIVKDRGSFLDFQYFEKLANNYATAAPPGTTIFRHNMLHLGRDAFTKQEQRQYPWVRGQWGVYWLVGVLPDGRVRALPCRMQHLQKLPSGSVVHHSAFHIPPALCRDKHDKPRDPHEQVLRWFLGAAVMTASILSGLQVTIRRGNMAVRIGIPITNAKTFFAARDPDGSRRKAILHLRRPHQRTLADGREIVVGEHLAGNRFFTWRGYEVMLSAPGIHHKTIESFDGSIYTDDEDDSPIPAEMVPISHAAVRMQRAIARQASDRPIFRRGEPLDPYPNDSLLPLGAPKTEQERRLRHDQPENWVEATEPLPDRDLALPNGLVVNPRGKPVRTQAEGQR